MTSLTEFLFPAPAPRSAGKIIAWWERRRLFYNLFVGAGGLVSVVAGSLAASVATRSIQIVPWQPVVVFGVLANLCYLLGPAAEMLVHRLWGRTVLPIGPSLYRMGLTFSVGLALLPTLVVTLWAVAMVVLSVLG